MRQNDIQVANVTQGFGSQVGVSAIDLISTPDLRNGFNMFRLTQFFNSPDLNPFAGQGRVEQLISGKRHGRIYFQGTYWPAKFAQSHAVCCHPGEFVEVVGRQGLTLLVIPIIEDDVEPSDLSQAMVV